MGTLRGVHKQQQRGDENASASGLLEATLLDPPLTEDGWMRVEVDEQKGAVRECPWMPRADALPEPGFAAVVQESDAGNMWVIAWWPQ